MLEYKKEELYANGKWFKSISTGDTKVFRKYLTEREDEFFITSDEDKERHLKGRIYIDEGGIYPKCEDKIVESLTPDSRLDYIVIVLDNENTHNNLDVLYALLHNYHLVCKELSLRIIDALCISVVDIERFSCFSRIRQKWNDILYELSLTFNMNFNAFNVGKDDWMEYSQWSNVTPISNPQESIEEYLKPHLIQKPKEVEVDIVNSSEQGVLFENTIKKVTPPVPTKSDLVIDYINLIYFGGYSSGLLEMVESVELDNTMIWVYKDNLRYIAISNTFPAVLHYYKDVESPLSPKELAIQVYTFGVDYKPRFSSGHGNWVLPEFFV